MLRFLARSDNHIIISLCADKNGLFIFSGRKKTTIEANWSEVNRNGLHPLEESLDLEDNSIIVVELQLIWFIMYAFRNNLLSIVTLLHYRDFVVQFCL